ncbi:MAG: M20 family metallopeptidase [Christensenella sp.]
MRVRQQVVQYLDEITKLRRELHKIPEYSFKEYNTSEYLMDYLKCLKPDLLENVAGTGIKAVFSAKKPQKTVAIRADIDGLPVTEHNDISFRSQHDNMMHACGHDGHMAAALICAKIISGARDRLKNNYVFLFQPAEETTGGALPMIEAGALKNPNVDEIYGIHLWPYLKAGLVGTKAGPLMADMCDLNITVKGRGSHGAKPQDGRDALVAAAQLIMGVQSIISRNVDPYKTGVITIGKISGGETRNVICEKVTLEGTIRTFEPKVTAIIKRRLAEMLEGLDIMYGVQSEYAETMTYPAVVNDEKLYEKVKEKFSRDELVEVEPVMISEDFSNFQRAVKGVYAFVGIAETTDAEPLHSSRFNFNEQVLLNGVEYFLRVTDFE